MNDQDLQDLRDESVARLRYVWDRIEATYGQSHLRSGRLDQDDEDEIDLSRLEEEVSRSQYFQRTPSPSPSAASHTSYSGSGTDSESHVTESEADGNDQMHQSYFRARREMLNREYRKRYPQVHLSDSEDDYDGGKDSEVSEPEEEGVAASSRSPTPCQGKAGSDTETESVGVIGDRDQILTEPVKKEETPQPRPIPAAARPFHPSIMLRQFRSFMPSFSPAPPPSRIAFADAAEPPPSSFVKAESLEPAEALDISSDSDWDDAPLATPKKEESDHQQEDALKTPTRPRTAKEGDVPSTTKQLPMAKLGLESSPVRRGYSHTRFREQSSASASKAATAPGSSSRTTQKQTVKAEEPAATSCPFVSLKSLSIPPSSPPLKHDREQPQRASPTKTRSEQIRQHLFSPQTTQKSGLWAGDATASEQSSSRSSTYDAEEASTASEDELARWDR